MSNESYEKLHKLVAFLLQSGIISSVEISKVLNTSLSDFQKEFEDEISTLDCRSSVD